MSLAASLCCLQSNCGLFSWPVVDVGCLLCRRSCSSRKSKTSEVQDWCCSIDADLVLLLTSEEMDTYHQRVLPAAALRSQELKQCPQTDCIGLAVAEQGRLLTAKTLCSSLYGGFCMPLCMAPPVS